MEGNCTPKSRDVWSPIQLGIIMLLPLVKSRFPPAGSRSTIDSSWCPAHVLTLCQTPAPSTQPDVCEMKGLGCCALHMVLSWQD